MSEKPEALRLADALAVYLPKPQDMIDAAAELRRLHEIETLYLAAMRGRHAMSEELLAATRQRDTLRQIVDEQAEDEGLWFRAETAAEAYLQQELRRLHAAVEKGK